MCWSLDPTLFGLFKPHTNVIEFIRHTAIIWLALRRSRGLLFRTVQLFFIQDVQTGLVWFTKILTDPFHDIMLYYKAPLYLMRGELIDPARTASSTPDRRYRIAMDGGRGAQKR